MIHWYVCLGLSVLAGLMIFIAGATDDRQGKVFKEPKWGKTWVPADYAFWGEVVTVLLSIVNFAFSIGKYGFWVILMATLLVIAVFLGGYAGEKIKISQPQKTR